MSGVSEPVAKELQKLGVEVVGDILPLDSVIEPAKPNSIAYPFGEFDDGTDESDDQFSDESESDYEEETIENKNSINNEEDCVDPSEMQLNLDITALFALVSNLTNGHAKFEFDEVLLNEQAGWERERPVLPELTAILKGS